MDFLSVAVFLFFYSLRPQEWSDFFSELHPVTFWRRVLLVRVRSRQLAHTELTHSLAALDTAARRSEGTVPDTNTGGNP